MKLLVWIVFNMLCYAVLYIAFVMGDVNMQSVVKFWVWFTSVTGILCGVFLRGKYDDDRPVARELSLLIGLSHALIMVYYGWMFYAILDLTGSLFVQASYREEDK
jgi:hypothetical protein